MEFPKLIVIPLIVGVLVAFVKIVEAIGKRELSWKTFTAYGGMPSFHTAFVVSLVTVIGYSEGIASPLFAIATVFALIVIRDAMGFRRYIGSQARVLNSLVEERQEKAKVAFEHLEERVGHSPLEVIVGGILGFLIATALYVLIP